MFIFGFGGSVSPFALQAAEDEHRVPENNSAPAFGEGR